MKMTYLGIVASGRRVAVSLSRASKAPAATSFARHANRSLMSGTHRRVTSVGSHSFGIGDHSSLLCYNRSNGKTNSSSVLISSREYRASPARHQSSDDFAVRAQQFGLASKEEVALAAEDASTVFLDVRSPPEIQDTSLTSRPCVEIWCTMDDTSRLKEEAEQLMPDKDATIVIFCAVGGRASVAKMCLEEMGYKNVLNAGGLCDLDNIQ